MTEKIYSKKSEEIYSLGLAEQRLGKSPELLKDDELLVRTRALVDEEKKVTLQILHHFREIERRRLYALRGFSSLFEMATLDFRYSEAAASRRIAAARLLSEVPEVEQKVEDGALSVTTLSTLQYFFNDQKRKAKPLSLEGKRELIEKVEHKSKRETEKILAVLSGEPIRRDQTRVVSQTHCEIRFTAEERLLKNLEKIRELKGHIDLKDYNSLLLYMSELVLDRIDPERKIQKKNTTKFVNVAGGVNTSSAVERMHEHCDVTTTAADKCVVAPPKSEQAVRNTVWRRDAGTCTYVDPITKRRCASRYALEYDHIVPKAMGGPFSVENLRLRCRAHNALYAIQTYGAKKMQPFLST